MQKLEPFERRMKEYLKGNEGLKDSLIKGLDYTVSTRFTGKRNLSLIS